MRAGRGWRRTTSVENADGGAIVERRHWKAAVVVGGGSSGSSSSSSKGIADGAIRSAVVDRTQEVIVLGGGVGVLEKALNQSFTQFAVRARRETELLYPALLNPATGSEIILGYVEIAKIVAT